MEHFITQTQFDLLYGDAKEYVFFLRQNEHSFEYVFVNQNARLIFKENPIHSNLIDMVSSSHAEEISEHYHTALNENKMVTYRDFFIFSDVELINETTVKPIFTENGTYILATTKEVSGQKEIEDKYLFMQSLLEMNVDPTIIVTIDGKIFDMNPKFEEVFGYVLKEWRGKHFLNLPFIPSNERSQVEKHFESNLREPGKASVLVKRKKTSGDEGTFLVSYSLIKKNGEAVAMYILLQEVTDEVALKESLYTTRHILESYQRAISKAAMVLMTNRKGKIEYVNELFEEISGYTPQELIGRHISAIQIDQYNDVHLKTMWKEVLNKRIWRGEIKNRGAKGSFYWGDTTVIPLSGETGGIENVLIIQFDITEKKNVMIELQNIEKTFNLITENTNDLISITDESGRILYTSPSHERILGLSRDELFHTEFSEMLSSEYQNIWKEDVLKRVNEEEEIRLELQYSQMNEGKLWTETSIVAVKDLENQGKLQHVIVSREITERKKWEEHLRFMAYHDSLTQLPNRRFLLKEFSQLVENARQSKTSMAVLYLDGDDFKSVNDTYGHDIGDEFLKMLGEALMATVRDQDLVVRFGGDEFVIVLTQLSNETSIRAGELQQIIHHIQSHLKIGWQIKNTKFTPTISIGITLYPDHGNTIDGLLEKADIALYEVKKRGKNQYQVYCE